MLGVVNYASRLFRSSAEERKDRLGLAICHREFEAETASSQIIFAEGPMGPLVVSPEELKLIQEGDITVGLKGTARYVKWARFLGKDPKALTKALQ